MALTNTDIIKHTIYMVNKTYSKKVMWSIWKRGEKKLQLLEIFKEVKLKIIVLLYRIIWEDCFSPSWLLINSVIDIILKIFVDVIFAIQVFWKKSFNETMKKQKPNPNILITVCFQQFSKENKIWKQHISISLHVFSATRTLCSKNLFPFVEY